MKMGLFAAIGAPPATAEGLAELGRQAEERGYDSVWMAEHVVMFDDYAREYPYAEDGTFPAPADAGLPEPLTALGFLAGVTERIRLGTGICLLPQRNPVYTAKEVANVDWLSGGRVDFGIGVGWQREEFAAVDVPFEQRGARTDDYLGVLKALWTEEVSAFHGEHYDLPDCRMYPKPVQSPHPPIHVGGESAAAMRRVARHGDGWYTFNRDPDDLTEALTDLDRALAAEGRDRADVAVSTCPYLKGISPEMVSRFADMGVDRVIALFIGGDAGDVEAQLDGLQPCLDASG
jgi:probable F420-dependent oxidoreductase